MAVKVSFAIVVAVAAACASCESTIVPSPADTVDLGDGTVATLGTDGSLTVTRDGAVLISSPPGASFVSRSIDNDSPDGWHDPTKTTAYTFDRLTSLAVHIDSPAPGVLHVTTSDDGKRTALVRLALATDAGFYTGMGERFDHVDPRGRVVPMHMSIDAQNESGTTDAHVPVPLLVSSRGYGVFVESREAGAFDVGAADPGVVSATFEGKTTSAWLLFARDPLQVVASYTQHVGLPRAVPRWALGPMYWRNEWTSDTQMLDDAAQMRTLHIPATTMWIDNPWQVSYNDFAPDPARFPDPALLMGELAALGYRILFWSTPYLEKPNTGPPDEARQLYAQADATPGVLVRMSDGSALSAPGFDAKQGFGMVDFSTSSGRDFWAGLASRAVGLGGSGFKLDYGEDIIPQIFNARLGVRFADGSTDRTARAYPLGYHAAYHEALDAAGGGIVIVRASSWGGASIADIVWPGDLDNDFEKAGDVRSDGSFAVGGLPAAIVAAQTLSVSGFPSFASDTGGFRHGAPTKEALLRWAEHTALSVIMQLGGGGDTHAPWAYDSETVALYKNLATLHAQLEPYLSTQLALAESSGAPIIRPLPLAFPDDVGARAVADDEYLLGPDLLVAPVVEAGATSRSVHFPAGRWVSFWAGDVVDGPADAQVPAPLGTPPLFARAGAAVPMLAADIDTLAQASVGSVVTVFDRASTVEGRAWVRGPAQAGYDDGASLAIGDSTQGVSFTFTPGAAAQAVVVLADLRSRTGQTAPITHVTAGGSDLPKLADENAVRAASGSAYALTGDSLVLRLEGATTALAQ